MSEFEALLTNEIQPWLKEHVHDGWITSEDGLKLHYYQAVNPNEKAAVVMIHGFCEFFGKYHETAYRFYKEGYSVFFLELRGHGKSQRERQYEDERVYVSSFEDYVEDIHSFMSYVREYSLSKRYFLFAHSMGGTAAALYMEKYPQDFTCAVLSSPMLKVNYGKIPDAAVDVLAVYTKIHDQDDEYAPGQHAFTGKDEFDKSSCLDYERYMYQLNQRRKDHDYQTWGATWGWARAAKSGSEKALRNANKIKTPVLLCQAGKDTMVRLEGQNIFDQNCPTVTLIQFPESKHELFNADQETRDKYFESVLAYFKAYAKK